MIPPGVRGRAWVITTVFQRGGVRRWWSPAAGFRRCPKPCPGRP